MEWISVKDRLPEEDVEVLFVWHEPDRACGVPECYDGNICVGRFRNNKWSEIYSTCSCYSCNCDDPIEVTYWMPLPERPHE